MSDVVQLSAGVPIQSISEVLSPGIVGLFIQGLETGLVLSQISQFIWLGRREGVAINLLVLFVTTVGLSAFASPSPFPHLTNHWFWGPVHVACRPLSFFCPHGGAMFTISGKP